MMEQSTSSVKAAESGACCMHLGGVYKSDEEALNATVSLG